jgi:hypothetical protein
LKTSALPLGLSFFALGLMVCAGFALGAGPRPAASAAPKLSHMVFFTLKDHSDKARETFIASCQKYLTNHEGAEFYSIGTQTDDVVEPGVGVKDFDIALHVIFASKEAEAAYLKHPRHLKFVEENKDGFAKVRVFDSYVVKP